MVLANQTTERRADADDEVTAARREQVAREIRERVARYRISESELRRVLDEVDRERAKQALAARREAEQEQRRARERALHVVRQLVEFWRIEPRELASGKPAAPRPAAHRAVKYRHPVTGETWDGAGAQPEWLRRALGQEGYRVAELQPAAVESACTGEAPAPPGAR